MQSRDQKELFVFVLMPFNPEFDRIYTDLIVSALESEGCRVQRADDFLNLDNILKDIIPNIVKADLIVAELTSLNPNVMYEVGIAHTLSKPTILLTQTIGTLPFDLRSYRAILYSKDIDKAEELQEKLRKIIQEFRKENIIFGNPVTEYAYATQINRTIFPFPDREIREDEASNYRKNAKNYLMEFKRRYDRINEQRTIFERKLSNYLIRISSLEDPAKPGSINKFIEITRALKSDFNNHSQRIETEIVTTNDPWEKYFKSMIGYFFTVNIRNEKDRKEIENLASNIEGLLEEVRRNLSAAQELRQTLERFGAVEGIGPPMRRYLVAIHTFIENHKIIESSLVRLTNLANERLLLSERNK